MFQCKPHLGSKIHISSSSSVSLKQETAMLPEAHPANDKLNDEAIERHRKFLEDRINPDLGLLEKLCDNGALSFRELAEVKDKSPFQNRNSLLLNYILDKHQGDRLVEALRDTGQIHIVNYLDGNGGECC